MGRRLRGRAAPVAAAFLALLAALALTASSLAAGASVARRSPVRAGAGGGGVPANPSADAVAPALPAGVGLDVARRWVAAAIVLRQARLGVLTAQIGASTTVSAADRTKLDGLVATAGSGLTSLLSAVQSATSLDQLRASAASMVLNYHVFAVLSPQVRLTLRADALLTPAAKLQALEPGIQTLITTEKAGRLVTRRARSLARDFQDKLTALTGTVGGLETQLLGLSAAQYATALATFTTAGGALVTGTVELAKARLDLRQLATLFAGSGLATASKARAAGL